MILSYSLRHSTWTKWLKSKDLEVVMEVGNFDEMVAYDFNNLDLGQLPNVDSFYACKSCNCDHCNGTDSCNNR
jgi:hypothetical protein